MNSKLNTTLNFLLMGTDSASSANYYIEVALDLNEKISIGLITATEAVNELRGY